MTTNICPRCKETVIKSGVNENRLCLSCGYEATRNAYYRNTNRFTSEEFVESRARLQQLKENKYWDNPDDM